MILSCVVPPPFPFPLPVLLLPPQALSRRTKMMPVTRTNHRLCRLHAFIDCLLSVFAGHLRDQLKCCRQPIPLIGRFSCYSDTCRRCSSPFLPFPPRIAAEPKARRDS